MARQFPPAREPAAYGRRDGRRRRRDPLRTLARRLFRRSAVRRCAICAGRRRRAARRGRSVRGRRCAAAGRRGVRDRRGARAARRQRVGRRARARRVAQYDLPEDAVGRHGAAAHG
ncbi:hypothetical protein NUJ28_26910 [Burkholderia multivorans]|nr:hypothetical protein NUJ28_26910 [Burkholderia multivorans]